MSLDKKARNVHSPKYNMHFEEGTYNCKPVIPVFKSDSKFDSPAWPSFDAGENGAIVEKLDKTHGMIRTEILCAKYGGHLGHVFNDSYCHWIALLREQSGIFRQRRGMIERSLMWRLG